MVKTILVVDDDPAVLQSYGRLLRRLGHRVLLSEDSEKVMTDPESLREIDLLILDRAQGAAGAAPAVILISAFLSHELRVEAIRLGVVEIIEKPIDTAHLLASVRAALSGADGPRTADPPISR